MQLITSTQKKSQMLIQQGNNIMQEP